MGYSHIFCALIAIFGTVLSILYPLLYHANQDLKYSRKAMQRAQEIQKRPSGIGFYGARDHSPHLELIIDKIQNDVERGIKVFCLLNLNTGKYENPFTGNPICSSPTRKCKNITVSVMDRLINVDDKYRRREFMNNHEWNATELANHAFACDNYLCFTETITKNTNEIEKSIYSDYFVFTDEYIQLVKKDLEMRKQYYLDRNPGIPCHSAVLEQNDISVSDFYPLKQHSIVDLFNLSNINRYFFGQNGVKYFIITLLSKYYMNFGRDKDCWIENQRKIEDQLQKYCLKVFKYLVDHQFMTDKDPDRTSCCERVSRHIFVNRLLEVIETGELLLDLKEINECMINSNYLEDSAIAESGFLDKLLNNSHNQWRIGLKFTKTKEFLGDETYCKNSDINPNTYYIECDPVE